MSSCLSFDHKALCRSAGVTKLREAFSAYLSEVLTLAWGWRPAVLDPFLHTACSYIIIALLEDPHMELQRYTVVRTKTSVAITGSVLYSNL